MSEISDTEWAQINSASGLPAEARADVEAKIRSYREDDGAEYNRVKTDTRSALSDAKTYLHRLLGELTLLQSSSDFRNYNSGGDAEATSLAAHLATLELINVALDTAEERLSKRSRKNWPRRKLQVLFIDLLKIRSRYLNFDLPNQAKETTASGSFHTFLELSLGLAEATATKAERAKMLKEGIDLAVESCARLRADPIYSWMWEELFPQSYTSLIKSRRYLNG